MNISLTLIVVLLGLVSIWFHFAAMDSKNKRIAALRNTINDRDLLIVEWQNYAHYLESLCNSKDVDLYFARANYEVSRDPIAYSLPVGTSDKGETIYDEKIQALTLPLMPVANHGSRIALDDKGRFVFTLPDPVVESTEATDSKPANSSNGTSKAKDNSAAIASDKGSFSSTEPDYSALAAKYKGNAKYNEFIAKINKAHKGKRTTNQINYLLAKFDQWENKPNTTDEYCKRVTADHMTKNK